MQNVRQSYHKIIPRHHIFYISKLWSYFENFLKVEGPNLLKRLSCIRYQTLSRMTLTKFVLQMLRVIAKYPFFYISKLQSHFENFTEVEGPHLPKRLIWTYYKTRYNKDTAKFNLPKRLIWSHYKTWYDKDAVKFKSSNHMIIPRHHIFSISKLWSHFPNFNGNRRTKITQVTYLNSISLRYGF